MTHHRYDRRLPKRTEGFAWARTIDKVMGSHVLVYRLFRRNLGGGCCTSARCRSPSLTTAGTSRCSC